MALVLSLLLATAFPSASRTSWMRLESFQLTIGMNRGDAIAAVKRWNPKRGKDDNEVFVDYDSGKSLTLEFRDERLRAVRFELFTVLSETRKVFEEERSYLQQVRGAPRKATQAVLVYDNALPNLMVAMNDDPKSVQGRNGLGVLAVRFYDPR